MLLKVVACYESNSQTMWYYNHEKVLFSSEFVNEVVNACNKLRQIAL